MYIDNLTTEETHGIYLAIKFYLNKVSFGRKRLYQLRFKGLALIPTKNMAQRSCSIRIDADKNKEKKVFQ